MGDIGHNGASRSENIQKQAMLEEIKEAIMRKMGIKKQKAGKYPKSRKIREQVIEIMRDIGHNGASRSENIQKQAMSEEIKEVIMRKMDIKKQKAGKISKTTKNRKQVIEIMRDIGHNGASRSEYVQYQIIAWKPA